MPKLNRNYWRNFLLNRKIVSPLTEDFEEQREVTRPKPAAPTPVEDEMQTFIDRVTERLIPIHQDYPAHIKKRLLDNRKRYRRELLDILNGKGKIEKWFDKTRNELGLHAITLTTILYESLKGLKSKEAKELRLLYGETLQSLSHMYQVR